MRTNLLLWLRLWPFDGLDMGRVDAGRLVLVTGGYGFFPLGGPTGRYGLFETGRWSPGGWRIYPIEWARPTE